MQIGQKYGNVFGCFPSALVPIEIFFDKYEKKFAIMFCFQGLIMDILVLTHRRDYT